MCNVTTHRIEYDKMSKSHRLNGYWRLMLNHNFHLPVRRAPYTPHLSLTEQTLVDTVSLVEYRWAHPSTAILHNHLLQSSYLQIKLLKQELERLLLHGTMNICFDSPNTSIPYTTRNTISIQLQIHRAEARDIQIKPSAYFWIPSKLIILFYDKLGKWL